MPASVHRHIVLVLNLVDRFFKVFGGISFSHLQKSGFIALFCQGYFNAFFKLFLKIILQKLLFAELLADNFGRYFVVLIILNDKARQSFAVGQVRFVQGERTSALHNALARNQDVYSRIQTVACISDNIGVYVTV